MKFLLDTQCWLWLNTEPNKISATLREQLERSETERLLSAASAWEIAIKFALGKLPLPESPAIYVPRRLRDTQTAVMAITEHHALHVADLPPHHRDPFDRLIIAQAQIERLRVVTADPHFGSYDVDVIAP
jgi:PIN domain nuclease of toxin-antitoxin system